MVHIHVSALGSDLRKNQLPTPCNLVAVLGSRLGSRLSMYLVCSARSMQDRILQVAKDMIGNYPPWFSSLNFYKDMVKTLSLLCVLIIISTSPRLLPCIVAISGPVQNSPFSLLVLDILGICLPTCRTGF